MYNNKTKVNGLADKKLAYGEYESHMNLESGESSSRGTHGYMRLPKAKQVIHAR